jgi:hypothetical protein
MVKSIFALVLFSTSFAMAQESSAPEVRCKVVNTETKQLLTITNDKAEENGLSFIFHQTKGDVQVIVDIDVVEKASNTWIARATGLVTNLKPYSYVVLEHSKYHAICAPASETK